MILKRKDKIIYFSCVIEAHVTHYNGLKNYKTLYGSVLPIIPYIYNSTSSMCEIFFMYFFKTADVVYLTINKRPS